MIFNHKKRNHRLFPQQQVYTTNTYVHLLCFASVHPQVNPMYTHVYIFRAINNQ
jgi:hypothetical protein